MKLLNKAQVIVFVVILPAILIMLVGCQNLRPAQRPLLKLQHAHDFGATRLAFSADSRFVASGGFQGEIKVWRVPDGKLLLQLKQHKRAVRGLLWLDNNTLASVAADGRLNVWRVWHKQVIRSRLDRGMTSLAYLAKSKQLLVGYKNGIVKKLDQISLETVAKYDVGSALTSIAVNPKNSVIAVSTKNKQVLLLTQELKRLALLYSGGQKIYELRFSANGNMLAGSTWFNLLIWNFASSTTENKFNLIKTEHFGAIVSLDFSPDNRQLISLGRHTDANIRLIDIKTASVKRRLSAHEYCGWHIRFSPNGRYVASASEDESIRFYDISIPYKPSWNQN